MQRELEKETAKALFYAHEFIQDQLPANLIAMSLEVNVEKKHIKLRAHFESSPSDSDLEAIQITSTEIAAQYYDWGIDEDWEVLVPGQEPKALSGGIAFRRGDPNVQS